MRTEKNLENKKEINFCIGVGKNILESNKYSEKLRQKSYKSSLQSGVEKDHVWHDENWGRRHCNANKDRKEYPDGMEDKNSEKIYLVYKIFYIKVIRTNSFIHPLHLLPLFYLFHSFNSSLEQSSLGKEKLVRMRTGMVGESHKDLHISLHFTGSAYV